MFKFTLICGLLAALVVGVGYLESHREECPTCHRALTPMEGFPNILEFPCGFKVDISR